MGTFNDCAIPPEWAPAVIKRVAPPASVADRVRYHIGVTGGFRSGTARVVDGLTIRRPPPAPR